MCICVLEILWNQFITPFKITWPIIIGVIPTNSEQIHTKPLIENLYDRQMVHSSNFTQAKVYLFPVELVFVCMEKARTSLLSILHQLATDASLQSTNPNCTWWAKLIALVLPDLPTAVRGNLSQSPFSDPTLTHTLCSPIFKMRGGCGHWEWV